MEFDTFLNAYHDFLIARPTFDRILANEETNDIYPDMIKSRTIISGVFSGPERFIYFRTHRILDRAWAEVIRTDASINQLENDDELADYFLNKSKLILTDAEFRGRAEFRGVFNLVYNLLSQQAFNFGSQGIQIEGYSLDHIRIVNNKIDGFLQGISILSRGTAVDGTRGAPNHKENMIIAENTINIVIPPVVHQFEKTGMKIENYKNFTIKNNTITLQRLPGDLRRESLINRANINSVDGMRIDGVLGSKMLITKNSFLGHNGTANFNSAIAFTNVTHPQKPILRAMTWNIGPGFNPLMHTQLSTGVLGVNNIPT